MDKELEKNKKETRIEKSREDKLLAFIGGKFIIYILLNSYFIRYSYLSLYRNIVYFYTDKYDSFKYNYTNNSRLCILLHVKSIGELIREENV